jgi:two-component system nitrogen regulation sensor histidine kinase NtrY
VALDDVTPLMQAQRVAAWGEVARKLAHEIKNPLTPIKLSAQRAQRAHFKKADDFDRVLTEATSAIVSEVDALQNLVDEFAHFARLPPSRPVEGSLNAVVEGALALYETAYPAITLERDLPPDLPETRLDAPQMKRVVINLVDNAIDALAEKGVIRVATAHDRGAQRLRLTVADDGPGVPPGSRETVFVPNFSTKRKGSGLGLAIARRIVEDHGGEIRVEDNEPKGARFVVELPA